MPFSMSHTPKAAAPKASITPCRAVEPPDGADQTAQRQLEALPAPEGRGVRGFTLIEIVVVVAILGILVSISIVGGAKLIDSNRSNATRATMETLGGAIDAFKQDNAAKGVKDTKLGQIGGVSFFYGNLFGDYPPSPASNFAANKASPTIVSPEPDESPAASAKLNRLLEVLTELDHSAMSRPSPDYPSIEAMLIYIDRLSPRGRSILQSLGDARVNLDKDVAFIDADGDDLLNVNKDKPVDLLEVLDAWKHPLRYAVKPRGIGGFMWELRSSGPDERFADCDPVTHWQFCDEDASGDDIVLRGPGS